MPKSKEDNQLKKFIFWGVLVLLIFLSFSIIKPFIIPLISAFILAYLIKPIFNKLEKPLSKPIAALLCIALVSLIILLPLGTITSSLTSQAYSALNSPVLSTSLESLSSYPIIQSLHLDLPSLTEKGISLTLSLFTSALSQIPSILLSLLILLFGMYYILLKWDFLSSTLQKYLPFKNKTQISKDISKTTKQLVYGTILIGIIEFIVSVLGFSILGIKSFILLSVLVFLFAFIPLLGPVIIWLPMTIYYFVTSQFWLAISVLILGLILSVGIDTILRSKLLGKQTQINPLIMLIGILGGISIFGIFGFIIGPIILVYTLKLLEEALKAQ